MLKACATTRVPGRRARICGRSFMLSDGRRYRVRTVAWVKSETKISPWTICALPSTPAARALRCACATMSGLYSMPSERAPNFFAAAMAILPSRATGAAASIAAASPKAMLLGIAGNISSFRFGLEFGVEKGGYAPFGSPKLEAVEKRFPLKLDFPWNSIFIREAFFDNLFSLWERRTGERRAGAVYCVYYNATAAWSARRERSPRCRVTCPECDQPFMRSTT